MTTIDDERLAEARRVAYRAYIDDCGVRGERPGFYGSAMDAAVKAVLTADDAFWARQPQAVTEACVARLVEAASALLVSPCGQLSDIAAGTHTVVANSAIDELRARLGAFERGPRGGSWADAASARGYPVVQEAALASPPGQQPSTVQLPAFDGASLYALDRAGQFHYINHAGTWQPCPPPIPGAGPATHVSPSAPASGSADIAELCDRAAQAASTVLAWNSNSEHLLKALTEAFSALAARERRLAPLRKKAREDADALVSIWVPPDPEAEAWRALSRLLEDGR